MFTMKLFIACSLMIGATNAIFGNSRRQDKTKAHDANKNDADLQGQGSSGGGIFTNIKVKPIFTNLNIKPQKTGVATGKPSAKTSVKKVDVKKKTEIARMSIDEVLQKFPNPQFTFKQQAQKFVGGNEKPYAQAFYKIKKGDTAKAPTSVAFAVPGECKPVDYCEDLGKLSQVHSGIIWPDSITYPKCMGCCLDHQVAVPVESVKRKVHIVVITTSPMASRVEEHEYEEHKSCVCQCKVKADQCNEQTQTYDQYNCRCECRPDAEAKSKCSPTQQWSDEFCGCICKYPDTVCGGNKVWNENTCTCDYKSHGGFGGFGR